MGPPKNKSLKVRNQKHHVILSWGFLSSDFWRHLAFGGPVQKCSEVWTNRGLVIASLSQESFEQGWGSKAMDCCRRVNGRTWGSLTRPHRSRGKVFWGGVGFLILRKKVEEHDVLEKKTVSNPEKELSYLKIDYYLSTSWFIRLRKNSYLVESVR